MTAERTVEGQSLWISRLIGAVGFALTAYIALGLVAGADWNPTIFIKFDEQNPPLQQYAGERFDEIVFAGGDGHDGKYFFLQASDPFYLQPDDHAFLLDRPTYRAQRMLYPTLAGGFGMFPPVVTAWVLVTLNVIAVGVGTYLTSRVAVRLGLSPMFGLAFFINPAIFVSAIINTAEVFGMVFLMGGILKTMDRKHTAAASLFTLSVLSRETMLLCVVGWVIFEAVSRKKLRWQMSLPFAAVAAWWVYLRWRIGYLTDDVQDVRALGRPLDGFLSAFQDWVSQPERVDDLLIGLGLVLICCFFVYLAAARRSLIPLMAAGFGLVGLLMVEEVWAHYFDSTRALTPLITFFFLSLPFVTRPHPEHFV
ncbi:MAG: hypothetical protein WD274_12180 [Acidimicrobiia bacterium]